MSEESNKILNESMEIYNDETCCSVCKAHFGIRGVSYNKNYSCKFCSKLVCCDCSSHKRVAGNPKARICVVCHKSQLAFSITNSLNQRLASIQ